MSIPKDIQRIFGNSELRRSLDTGNKIRAQAKARRAAFELRNLFFRLDGPDMAKKPTHQEIRRIVGDLFRTIADESERRLANAGPVNLPELIERQSNLEQAAGETRLALATCNHDVVVDKAREVIAKYDLDAPEGSPEFRLLCHEILKMKLDFQKVALARRQGDYTLERQLLPNAPVQLPPEPVRAMLGEGISKYLEVQAGELGKTSLDKYRPILSEFLEIVGDKPLASLVRDDMRDYCRVIHCLPKRRTVVTPYKTMTIRQLVALDIPDSNLMTSGTIDDRFVTVRVLLNWLADEYPSTLPHLAQLKKELVVSRKAPTTERKRAYTDDELRLLFEPTVYTGRGTNKGWKYWLPLLGLLTGARLGELGQLLVSDIKQEAASGVWYFDINDEEERQRLKTTAAKRQVPLHPMLMELGLLQRLQTLQRRKETHLFPALQQYVDPGNYPSNWFTTFRRSRGLGGGPGKSSPLDFHSFRRSFITRCKFQGLDRHKVKEIVGHEEGEFDDITAVYEERYSVGILHADVMSKLDFSEAIDLERLKCPKWQETP